MKEDNVVVVKIGKDRELLLKVDLFNDGEDIDVDDLLQIDYNNLLADLATFSVILNRFGLLLAEMENRLSESMLDLRVFKAKIRKDIRKDFEANKIKVTNDPVDDEMRSHAGYRVRYLKVISLTKQRDYISNVYWAAKAKSDNLNKLSLTIQPGDIDVDTIVGTFNGIKLRTFQTIIK